MNFSSDIKTVLFEPKFNFVIIGEDQWGKGKRHHQNCLTFDRIIPHDNGAVQMFKWLH